MLRWSKWFYLFLVGVAVVGGLSVIVRTARKMRRGVIKPEVFFECTLALFGLIGLATTVTKASEPPYIIYFSLWPLALLSTFLERWMRKPARLKLFLAIALVTAIAWIPSLAWNLARFREAVLYRTELSHSAFESRLNHTISPNGQVIVVPDLYMLAAEANLNFTVAPWMKESVPIPSGAWLLVRQEEYRDPAFFFAKQELARQVAFCTQAFPGARGLETGVCLLRPLTQ
jgi:hypothetical protein